MATIDGIDCNINDYGTTTTSRNTPIPIIGSDINPIVHTGFSGLVLQVTGFETSEAQYDLVIGAFLSKGPHTFVTKVGFEYIVHSARQNVQFSRGNIDSYYPYTLTLVCETPYLQSDTDIIRPKSITGAGQTWTQDNSSNDISTSGSVNTKPDIKIVGGSHGSTYNRNGKKYLDEDPTAHTQNDTTWVCKKTYVYNAKFYSKHTLEYLELWLTSDSSSYAGYAYVTYQYGTGTETTVPGASWSYDYDDGYTKCSLDCTSLGISTAANQGLTIRFYLRSGAYSANGMMKDLDCFVQTKKRDACNSPVVYNTADDTVKCHVANDIEYQATHVVNSDNTGTFKYVDNFDDDRYMDAAYDYYGVSRYTSSLRYDPGVAYIEYKFDTKYTITGIPVLTSHASHNTLYLLGAVDDGNGCPSDWVSIGTLPTAQGDTDLYVENELSFKGESIIFLRIYGPSGTENYLYDFEVNAQTSTLDAQKIEIVKGGTANTIKCDQASTSNNQCEVTLTYRNKKWS